MTVATQLKTGIIFQIEFIPGPENDFQIFEAGNFSVLGIKFKMTRCQFHQHFYVQIFCANVVFYVHVTRKSCRKDIFVWKICT